MKLMLKINTLQKGKYSSGMVMRGRGAFLLSKSCLAHLQTQMFSYQNAQKSIFIYPNFMHFHMDFDTKLFRTRFP